MTSLNLTTRPPRSPYAELAGLMFVARTIDKARALLPGGDSGAYTLAGISTRMFEHFGITEADFIGAVAAAQRDEDVLAWLGERVPAEARVSWNDVLLERRVGDHNRERMAERYPVVRADPSLVRIIDILVADDRQTFGIATHPPS